MKKRSILLKSLGCPDVLTMLNSVSGERGHWAPRKALAPVRRWPHFMTSNLLTSDSSSSQHDILSFQLEFCHVSSTNYYIHYPKTVVAVAVVLPKITYNCITWNVSEEKSTNHFNIRNVVVKHCRITNSSSFMFMQEINSAYKIKQYAVHICFKTCHTVSIFAITRGQQMYSSNSSKENNPFSNNKAWSNLLYHTLIEASQKCSQTICLSGREFQQF